MCRGVLCRVSIYVRGDYVQRNYMYVRRDGAEKYQLAPETVT